jgi:hypothetical protein
LTTETSSIFQEMDFCDDDKARFLRPVHLVDSKIRARWGYRKALYSRLMNGVRPWLVVCRINIVDLDSNADIRALPDGLTMRQATHEDLLAAIEESPTHFNRTFIDECTARGDFCVGAFDGRHMVSWAWVAAEAAPHIEGLCVKVEPPYSYGYKWFTKPEYRGKDIIARITQLRDKLSADAGCTHNVGFIETHNYASLTSSSRLGGRCVGHAGYLSLFGRFYPFRTPGVVKHKFRFLRT